MQSGLRGIAAPFGIANQRYKLPLPGALSRPASRKLAEIVTPQDFGAKGDGVVDDTDAFMAAAAAYGKGNFEFWCPDGEYLLSQGIKFLPNSGLIGADRLPPPALRFGTNAVLKATASIAGGLVEFGSDVSNFSGIIRRGLIHGGVFDANHFADYGLWIPFLDNCTILNAHAKNANLHHFKIGSNSAPQSSYEALFDQCKTSRIASVTASISAISKANPGVVTTSSPHGIINGETVTLENTGGMTEVSNRHFIATVLSPTTLSIGEDTTGYTTFTSGGTVFNGYSPDGSACIYFENISDSHASNCILNGAHDGISGTDLYGYKINNVHVWNFTHNRKTRYAFDMDASNILMGCQVDGPWESTGAAFRFSDKRNTLLGCEVTYEGIANQSGDNVAYPIKLESGAGADCFGCVWNAQNGSFRLAAAATGDLNNFSQHGCSAMNMVQTFDLIETTRRDQNAQMFLDYRNQDAGASAQIVQRFVTNAGTLFLIARSTAGGNNASLDWAAGGNLELSCGNAGGDIHLQTDYADRLIVEHATGRVKAVNPTGGIGYGTGAGGTIVQATSKSTAVTLNKVTGQITMNGAALGAGATVSFTVNNTAFNAATDTVYAHHASGGTAGAYRVSVKSAGSNAFAIEVTNTTGGSLSEAIVINFNVMKGASS